MNKLVIYIVIIALVGFLVWRKFNKTREEKIDFLNSMGAGPWVKMSDEELNDSYVLMRYVKSGVKADSIPAELMGRINVISAKYNIFT